MDPQVVIAGVELLAQVVEDLTSNAKVEAAINALEAWLPTIINSVTDLVPQIQGLIATLKGSDQLTPDQMAALDAQEAQIDASFDAAAKAAGV